MMVVFSCSIVNAQLIYSNNFVGGSASSILNVAPTYASDLGGGSSSALWNIVTNNPGFGASAAQNGTLGNYQNSVLLPFIPQAGFVYTLSGSITFTSDPGSWLELGYAAHNPSVNTSTGGNRMDDPGVNGNPWALFRPGTGNGGVALWYSRSASAGSQALIPQTFPETNTISLVLNTTAAQWSSSLYVGNTLVTNYTYAANPAITAIGYGQTTLAAGNTYNWNYLALSAVAVPITNNNCWVAPTATGTGDASSPANAASYLSSSFWSGAQALLQVTNVNVNFVNGTYNAGALNLNDMGDPLHRLTLQAVNPGGPVFSPAGNTIVAILGSQNIKFDGLVLTGPIAYWGVNCQPDHLKACRNLEFSNCQFVDLTNVVYGAIGLLDGTRDVLVDNCTFSTLTDNNGNHQHMIYASHDIEGVVVTNCYFQDCLADYVRFRDDSEYCTVQNCTFVSTMSASAWPFISVELYNETNSDSAGDEFFGNDFQINSNSFTYDASGGPGPYSAFHFSDNGYSPNTYHCDLSSSEAVQLAGGTVSDQQSFLQTNMGIIASGIKMFGNTYSGVANTVDYTYNWDGIQPNGGWSGTVGISGVPDSSGAARTPTPVLRNGNFDRPGLLLTSISVGLKNWECLFRTWMCDPKYTDILWHPGFDGTSNALRFDQGTSQSVYQWVTPPGPTWTMDCEFAIGSGFTGSGTKFQVDLFHNDVAGKKVSVGVNSSGQFGIYNGGAFTVLPELGTVAFSVDSNGNGNYTDPGDSLYVYRLRVVGNYAAAVPYVNIYTSAANSPSLNHQSLGLTDWVNGAPVSGQSSPETIAFYNYTAPAIVDQVAMASGLAGQPPVITRTVLSNGQFVLSGTNGFGGDNYYLLSSTNLASGQWTLEATNTFDASGAFSITNPVPTGSPQKFYRLQLQ